MADRVDVHSSSRLNAEAPEFVPSRRSQNQRHHPNPTVFQQQQQHDESSSLKLLNQVEYYFSDLNLATTDHLMRFIAKDPLGFVPISVVSSFNKIKALLHDSHAQLASVLRGSSKLLVSDDGKRVRRLNPITDADIEDLQSRIIVAENLPEDHCHQNLMKIFCAAGSVKNIRTCLPQPRSAKSDNMMHHYSNKLHAFVEYESVEVAEKAVTDLNDEANWRSGLRVRLMVAKRASQSKAGRGRKGEAPPPPPPPPLPCEEDEACTADQPSNEQPDRHGGEEHGNDKEGGQRKGRSRGRGKGRAARHHRGPTPPAAAAAPAPAINPPPGPRMPDGTRGFAMGRGKPLAAA